MGNMSNYIVFGTEAEATTATKLCWVKYVKEKVGADYCAVNSQEYTDVTNLTDTQICVLRLYGKDHRGINVKTKGLTINYQLYTKSYSADKWFAAQPPTAYLDLLSGYTVKTSQEMIDENYFPPIL